jgi:glycosyltransferase involved in cell wall biosynthesis
VFDYMAAGRPIILAADSANDPVAEAGCGRTIPPDDPVALAEAILALRALDPAERLAMGARGRAFVEREHGFPMLADRLVQVLRSPAP